MSNVWKFATALMFLLAGCGAAHAERIKDLASIQGVRTNQLVGYGLVVGLDGDGDKNPFTDQSTLNMLSQMGVNLPAGTSLQLKNSAAVMVTASLPAFSRPGQNIDVTVSSIGSAKSLRGGTLIMTPLKGADGQVYAMSQGNVLVGGVGASAGGSSAQINHLAVGRIPAGATVERAVSTQVGQGDYVNVDLNQSDFTTADRVVQAINRRFGEGTASAGDAGQVRVRAPRDASQRVAFISQMENLPIQAGNGAAKVIVNARTGSVVMNQNVEVDGCAVAHGNLSVTISNDAQVSQPNALAQGETTTTQNTQIDIKSQKGELVVLPASPSLGEVVKALNAVGASPQDLLAILQAMKAAGSLRAELEII